MGEVYLAKDLRLERQVALKLLPRDLTADPTRVKRFEQEARAASALNHPNVCTIHALGVAADGRHFIAMEYVEGQTLRERFVRGSLKRRESFDIAIQIASALTAAHASGIIHRDLKPENVVLRPDGFAKVLDFGLAKLVATESDPELATRTVLHTDAGTAVGTVAYMSPEQARAEYVDVRTDIWAVGVVLYEMVAGRRPFAGQSTSEVLAAILEHDPAPLARFDPDVPHELQRMVTKALRKDPEQRYQVMKDLMLDLQALRDQFTSSVTKEHTATAVARPSRHRIIAIGTAVVVMLGAAAAVWWVQKPHAGLPTTAQLTVNRPVTRLTFDPGLQTGATFSPDGRSIAYASDRSGNFDIWVQSIAGGDARQLTTSPSQETQPAWSPDGETIVFRSERDGGGLFIVPVRGGTERQLTSFGSEPAWSSDGSEIFFRTGFSETVAAIYTVNPQGGEGPRELLPEVVRNGSWYQAGLHPDGRISLLGYRNRSELGFFTISRDGRTVTVSSSSPGMPREWADKMIYPGPFQWDASGTALFIEASSNYVWNVWKIRVEPSTLEFLSAERLTTGGEQSTGATLSRDGKHVAYTAQRETIRLWAYPFDASRGRITGEGRPVTADAERIEDCALSPDGRTVAYRRAIRGGDRTELRLTDLDTGAGELVAKDPWGIAWSPDSRMIAYSVSRNDRPPFETALAIRRTGGPERLLSRWSTKSVFYPSGWSGDGRAILGSFRSPKEGIPVLALWTVSDGTKDAPDKILIADREKHLWQGRFSPDSRWVSFVAASIDFGNTVRLFVAPASGAPAAEWRRIAQEHDSPDKPRWAPDGRTLFFLSRHRSSFYNLWGIRFEPERGAPSGAPFAITNFDSVSFGIAPDLSTTEVGVAARRIVLPMRTVTGSIWMLEGVDR